MAPQDPQGNGYGADGYSSDGYNNQGEYDPTFDQGSEYYIDRGDTSETGEQAQQDAEYTADSQETGGNWITDVINMFTRQGRVDEAYNQQLTSQASELAQGVNTRQPPMMMCSNYMSVDHPALKSMVTESVDADAVGEMGDMWINAGNEMTRFQGRVATAINNSTTDWQGEGGDSARTFMADVGNWVGTAGQSAQLAGTQTNIQAESLAEAKRTMPDPVQFDAAAANQDLQSTSNPIDMMSKYATYMAQYNQQQEAHQQAAQVVGTYDSGLGSASTMPAFAKPPVMNNPNGGTGNIDSSSIDSIDNGGSGNPNGSSGIGGTGGGTGGTGGGGNPPVSIPPPSGSGGAGGTGSGGSGLPGTTGPSAGGTDYPGPGQFPVPGPTGPGQGGSGPGNSNYPQAPMPVGMNNLGQGGDMERRGLGGGRGFGPGGSGLGSGSGGMGGAGGAGSGMGGRGGMGSGGMGAGALAAENAAMRGGAGVGGGGAGGRGGAGMGGMGGARGKGEEDDEHQRPSFLVEGDPDAVFGTDQITAPPVIGE